MWQVLNTWNTAKDPSGYSGKEIVKFWFRHQLFNWNIRKRINEGRELDEDDKYEWTSDRWSKWEGDWTDEQDPDWESNFYYEEGLNSDWAIRSKYVGHPAIQCILDRTEDFLGKNTLETSGEHMRQHSKRVENMSSLGVNYDDSTTPTDMCEPVDLWGERDPLGRMLTFDVIFSKSDFLSDPELVGSKLDSSADELINHALNHARVLKTEHESYLLKKLRKMEQNYQQCTEFYKSHRFKSEHTRRRIEGMIEHFRESLQTVKRLISNGNLQGAEDEMTGDRNFKLYYVPDNVLLRYFQGIVLREEEEEEEAEHGGT